MKFVPSNPISHKSALFRVMVLYPASDKLLLIKFYDAKLQN